MTMRRPLLLTLPMQGRRRTASEFRASLGTLGHRLHHRAAGVYMMDKEMQELGTAAVHLLTMATSYMNARNE